MRLVFTRPINHQTIGWQALDTIVIWMMVRNQHHLILDLRRTQTDLLGKRVN